MSIGKKYILPLSLGFVGMFICHYGFFLCYQVGVPFTAYLIVYPIIYPAMTAILTMSKPRLWFTNAIFLSVIPFLYWYSLLWSESKLNANSFSLFEFSGMSVIILLALGVSVLVGLLIFKIKTPKPL
ncbi:MAG: hypothetical protein Q7S39_02440 [Ignavibacteria bacterium]|nr:hypothetical protein [Ignavibacteria bacterium]